MQLLCTKSPANIEVFVLIKKRKDIKTGEQIILLIKGGYILLLLNVDWNCFILPNRPGFRTCSSFMNIQSHSGIGALIQLL